MCIRDRCRPDRPIVDDRYKGAKREKEKDMYYWDGCMWVKRRECKFPKNIYGTSPPVDGQKGGIPDRRNPVSGDEYIDTRDGARSVSYTHLNNRRCFR